MSPVHKFLLFFVAAFLIGIAVTANAQNGFEGTYGVQGTEAILTLEHSGAGTLEASLGTASDKVHFSLALQGDPAKGKYESAGKMQEITIQLQPDGSTIFLWLKEADAPEIEEAYAAYRAVRQQEAAPATEPEALSGARASPFMPSAAESRATDLTGTWHTVRNLESGRGIWIMLDLAAQGTFTASYLDTSGNLLGWNAGHYQVENQTLTLRTEHRSEEICLTGTCQPFTGADVETVRIVSPGPDVLTVAVQDSASSHAYEIRYVSNAYTLSDIFRRQGSGDIEQKELYYNPCGTSSTPTSDDCLPTVDWVDRWE